MLFGHIQTIYLGTSDAGLLHSGATSLMYRYQFTGPKEKLTPHNATTSWGGEPDIQFLCACFNNL